MINVTHEFLVRLKKLGYSDLTPIQKIAIPKIISGKNTLIIAPTGSGKTEAAVLPIFYTVFKEKPPKISSLYITPLRALNRDIEDRLRKIGNEFGIEVNVRHGDSSQNERKNILQNPPDMLITTPETLMYLIINNDFRKYFENLRWIVIDELQEMLDEKRGIELSVVIQRIKKITKNKLQLIGISATIGDVNVAKKYLDKHGNVDVASINTIKDMKIDIITGKISKSILDNSNKYNLNPETLVRLEKINEITKTNKPVLIFTNTRETCEFLSSELSTIYNLKVAPHHGSLSKEVRIKSEEEFKNGKLDALVATSSLELGIDIGKVDLVIQYMSPRQVVRLIQRIGRSGHKIGKMSRGYIIPSDDIFDILECRAILESLYAGYLEKPLIQINPLDVAAHEIAGMVLEGYRDTKEILNILRESFYFETLSEDLLKDVIELLESAKIIKRIDGERLGIGPRIWKYYYGTNMIPDSIRDYLVIDYKINTKIGTLDEEFVAGIDEEDVFILSGKLWKVISIEKDKIYVDRVNELKPGILPSWFGESIPVEKEIAKRVYEYIINLLTNNDNKEDEERIRKIIKTYKDRGYPILRSDLILVEMIGNDLIFIHSPFGSRGNNTLGNILSYLLSKEKGIKVTYRYDPYHIVMSSLLPISEQEIEQVIQKLTTDDKYNIIRILRDGIKDTPQFKWKLLVEVKRFGLIDPEKEVQLTSPLIKAYANTLVGEEAVNELLVKNYDIDIFDEIRNYQWKVIRVPQASPLAKEFLDKLLNYTRASEDDIPLLVEMYKRRLENKELRVICLVCGWNNKYSIVNIPSKCPNCSSIFLTATNPDDIDSVRIIKSSIKGERLKLPERKKLEALKVIASLFSSYGKHTFIALAANGVGPSNLGRILSKLSEGEDKFYLAIMEEEKKFLRTRKYWQ
ncbi:MAG: DEAD/DEAH box helicase [Saccharolobus sp.]